MPVGEMVPPPVSVPSAGATTQAVGANPLRRDMKGGGEGRDKGEVVFPAPPVLSEASTRKDGSALSLLPRSKPATVALARVIGPEITRRRRAR